MNNLLRLQEGVARIEADDPWTLVRALDGDLPTGPVILPLARWFEEPQQHGVWLGPDDEVESLKPWFNSAISSAICVSVVLTALPFVRTSPPRMRSRGWPG